VKVLFEGTGEGEGYRLFESVAEHGSVRMALPPGFKGIGAEFRPQVDALLGKGCSPSQVLAELTLSCGEDALRKTRLPNKSKVKARKKALLSSPQFQFETVADMRAWVNEPGRLIRTREEFDAVVDFDKLLVFSDFFFMVPITDETEDAAEGATVQVPAFGFNYGSKRTVQQLGQVK
jgi:hypothetical protein